MLIIAVIVMMFFNCYGGDFFNDVEFSAESVMYNGGRCEFEGKVQIKFDGGEQLSCDRGCVFLENSTSFRGEFFGNDHDVIHCKFPVNQEIDIAIEADSANVGVVDGAITSVFSKNNAMTNGEFFIRSKRASVDNRGITCYGRYGEDLCDIRWRNVSVKGSSIFFSFRDQFLVIRDAKGIVEGGAVFGGYSFVSEILVIKKERVELRGSVKMQNGMGIINADDCIVNFCDKKVDKMVFSGDCSMNFCDVRDKSYTVNFCGHGVADSVNMKVDIVSDGFGKNIMISEGCNFLEAKAASVKFSALDSVPKVERAAFDGGINVADNSGNKIVASAAVFSSESSYVNFIGSLENQVLISNDDKKYGIKAKEFFVKRGDINGNSIKSTGKMSLFSLPNSDAL